MKPKTLCSKCNNNYAVAKGFCWNCYQMHRYNQNKKPKEVKPRKKCSCCRKKFIYKNNLCRECYNEQFPRAKKKTEVIEKLRFFIDNNYKISVTRIANEVGVSRQYVYDILNEIMESE